MQAITLNETAQDLLSVINKANDEPLLVTDEHNKSFVIMSLDDFKAWQETTDCSNAKDLQEAVKNSDTGTVRRKPSAKIAGKGHILGDIMTPVVAAEDWEALA